MKTKAQALLLLISLLSAVSAQAVSDGWVEITEKGAKQSAYIGAVKTAQLLNGNNVMFYMRGEYADHGAEYKSSVMRYFADCTTGESQRIFFATYQKHGLYGKPNDVSHVIGDVIPLTSGSVMDIAVSTACTLAGVEPTYMKAAEPVVTEPVADKIHGINTIETVMVVKVSHEGSGDGTN